MTITARRKSNTFYVILIAGAAAFGGFLLLVSGFSRITVFVWNRRLALDVLDSNSSSHNLWNVSFDDSRITPVLGC